MRPAKNKCLNVSSSCCNSFTTFYKLYKILLPTKHAEDRETAYFELEIFCFATAVPLVTTSCSHESSILLTFLAYPLVVKTYSVYIIPGQLLLRNSIDDG